MLISTIGRLFGTKKLRISSTANSEEVKRSQSSAYVGKESFVASVPGPEPRDARHFKFDVNSSGCGMTEIDASPLEPGEQVTMQSGQTKSVRGKASEKPLPSCNIFGEDWNIAVPELGVGDSVTIDHPGGRISRKRIS